MQIEDSLLVCSELELALLYGKVHELPRWRCSKRTLDDNLSPEARFKVEFGSIEVVLWESYGIRWYHDATDVLVMSL